MKMMRNNLSSIFKSHYFSSPVFSFFLLILMALFSGIITAQDNKTILSEDEINWLKEHPVIKVAPDPMFQPIEYFNESGEYSGIGADYVSLISRKTGIRFEIVRCKSWDEVIHKAKNRKIDVLNAVVKSPEREEYLIFPEPYLRIPSVIITRKNVNTSLTLKQLEGMNIVMVSGYGYVDLIKSKHPDIQIDLVESLSLALRKVSFGLADAFVGDLATASFYIEQEGISNLKISGETEPPNISGFAIRSDWPILASILEKSLSTLTEDEHKAIFNRHIHLLPEEGFSQQEIKKLLIYIFFFVFSIVLFFIIWNRQLKRMVNKKTMDLQREIDVRQKAEEALKKSEANFKALADTSPLAIYMAEGIQQKAVYINPTFINLFGYSRDEVPSAAHWWPRAYPDPDYQKKIQAEWEAKVLYAVENNVEVEPMLTEVTCKDGSKKYVLWTFIVLVEQNWSCGLDMTERISSDAERKALEEQLRHSHKMEAMGTLAGGIAHDFNNLLGAIVGNADLIKLTSENHKVKSFSEQIILASKRAKELIKQILAFSRKETVERIPLKVHRIIEDALKLLRPSIPVTTEIKINLDKSSGTILADPNQIHQVVVNLCTNASQAIENHSGVIQIGLESVFFGDNDLSLNPEMKPGKYVHLFVKDNGVGISEKVIDRIFDPYYTTKEVGKGSGLGLAVVTGIVKSQNGFIKVVSKINQGSTFHIYFPAIEKEELIISSQEESIPEGTETILFVDDEKLLVESTVISLKMLGYNVISTTSSNEALSIFKASADDFDLVITDQTMPEITGDELAEKLLEIRDDIPIILCTGFSSEIDEQAASEIGIRSFLMKPLTRTELACSIRDVLDNS